MLLNYIVFAQHSCVVQRRYSSIQSVTCTQRNGSRPIQIYFPVIFYAILNNPLALFLIYQTRRNAGKRLLLIYFCSLNVSNILIQFRNVTKCLIYDEGVNLLYLVACSEQSSFVRCIS